MPARREGKAAGAVGGSSEQRMVREKEDCGGVQRWEASG